MPDQGLVRSLMYQGWFRLYHSDALYLKQTLARHVGDRTGTVNSPLGSIDFQIYARTSTKQPPKTSIALAYGV